MARRTSPQTRGKSRPGTGYRRRKGPPLQGNGEFGNGSTGTEYLGATGDPDDRSSILEKKESVRGKLAMVITISSAIAIFLAVAIDLFRGGWYCTACTSLAVLPFVSAVVFHYFKKTE